MANLHPKTLAAIEAGPLAIEVDHDTGKVKKREHHTDFARRIALIAMEEEREALRDAFVDELMEADATWSRGEAMDVAQQAIRRRGKP